MAYTTKPLEELDLIDDFLMNSIASDKEVGEKFCRVFLSTLLQRKIGRVNVAVQKVIPPADTDLKGIRLDVKVEEPLDWEQAGEIKEVTAMNIYDIEPHLAKGTDLPRHNRFYQALIDSSNLKSGEKDYKHLPDLYILMILDRDPFGYDYMMYSIRNKCQEVEELEYEDGLQFYYFYTGGSKGGNDEIKTMLHYIRNSRKENAVDVATKEIHRLTEKVKIHPEVRKSYMFWEEYVEFLREEIKEGIQEEAREEAEEKIRKEAEERIRKEAEEKIRKEVRRELAEEILALLGEDGEVSNQLRERILSAKDMEV